MIFEAYDYQKTAIRWIIEKPRCGLFLDMGLGKTVATLTALQTLIDCCEVQKALVIAPKKVAETTWTSEAAKWDHLADLRMSAVLGDERHRIKALEAEADVYVINRDNFVWLMAHYDGRLPFDTLVIDELTSFKSSKSKRFRAMRIASASASRVIGLTGTPAPNGMIDLWAEMYCIDRGERLGRTISGYRNAYFSLYKWNNIIVRCDIKKGCDKIIMSKIEDICLSMKASDYLQLPAMIVRTVRVELPPKIRKGYDKFEREKVLEFQADHGRESATVMANSAAGLMNKLAQYANGAVYDEDHGVHEVHDEKLESLAEIVEAAGGSVLIYYQYRHDIDRIASRLKGRRVRVYNGAKDLEDWNAGRIDVLLAHPASTAYGLNMQAGGHYIIWFGTGWNLELYQQANARLHRQGQTHPVIVYRLLCRDTVDERAAAALDSKKNVQQGLLDGLNYLLKKYEQPQACEHIP